MHPKKSPRLSANFSIKPNLKKILGVLLFVPVLIFIIILLHVQKIDCRFNDSPCPQEIVAVLDKYYGENSLFINQKRVLQEIKGVYPVEKLDLSFKLFRTLKIKLEGSEPSIKASVFFVKEIPQLSMDQAPSTTDSAQWWVKPGQELEEFLKSVKSQDFFLFANGTMINTATGGAQLSYIFSKKPTPETVSSIFRLVKIAEKYLDGASVVVVNQRCFLSRQGQPDIIMLVPFNEESLVNALQSLNYLVTIKKDAKVIDLSFRNPIVR